MAALLHSSVWSSSTQAHNWIMCLAQRLVLQIVTCVLNRQIFSHSLLSSLWPLKWRMPSDISSHWAELHVSGSFQLRAAKQQIMIMIITKRRRRRNFRKTQRIPGRAPKTIWVIRKEWLFFFLSIKKKSKLQENNQQVQQLKHLNSYWND